MPRERVVRGLARMQIVKGAEIEVPGTDAEATLRNVQARPDGHDDQLGLVVGGVFMIHEISHCTLSAPGGTRTPTNVGAVNEPDYSRLPPVAAFTAGLAKFDTRERAYSVLLHRAAFGKASNRHLSDWHVS